MSPSAFYAVLHHITPVKPPVAQLFSSCSSSQWRSNTASTFPYLQHCGYLPVFLSPYLAHTIHWSLIIFKACCSQFILTLLIERVMAHLVKQWIIRRNFWVRDVWLYDFQMQAETENLKPQLWFHLKLTSYPSYLMIKCITYFKTAMHHAFSINFPETFYIFPRQYISQLLCQNTVKPQYLHDRISQGPPHWTWNTHVLFHKYLT